ncbi:hypothetical protein G6R29_00900 [Fructobacillus sp. M2-14]|uniref:Uncharacterized protein n=1 Tax=Fructobacillus broussonetiae TaxID=2713173 RepID=A0ABS5R0N8_9LACO|nr:hypothetical protein [Fructobacillus broussonetiae]MBS9338191.1 hypothetical protein [Fructobacillus broussonetiae]
MTFNRLFHIVMAIAWAYTFYLTATMQMMLAMYVMAGGMFVQAVYAAICNKRGC